jgi:hypothetical protein
MYSRTRNENGNLNSRCLYCFTTIAADVEKESDLQLIEVRHICPEKALTELLALKHTDLVQTPHK